MKSNNCKKKEGLRFKCRGYIINDYTVIEKIKSYQNAPTEHSIEVSLSGVLVYRAKALSGTSDEIYTHISGCVDAMEKLRYKEAVK
jgi:hypothetical protein